MIVNNPNTLIGDFIGTIPAMNTLHEKYPDVEFISPMPELFDMTGLKRSESTVFDISFDLHAAFALASRENLHMIQANYPFVGLVPPLDIPRPKLNVKPTEIKSFDYIIAPFGRSAPAHEKWDMKNWYSLMKSQPDKTFCIIGNSVFDSLDWSQQIPNCTAWFNLSMNDLCNLLMNAKHGCISIVTGISHLCYALNVPNYVLFNQGMWGKNPEAKLIEKNIPDITVDDMINFLGWNM
jgi:ADP-heptose:LPS heptosyltransferase